MSFYVTLNSDVDFIHNKISNFTTPLITPIKVDNRWEVGLVKVIFLNTPRVDLGYFTFYNASGLYSAEIKVNDTELTLEGAFTRLRNKLRQDRITGINFNIQNNKLTFRAPHRFDFKGTIKTILGIDNEIKENDLITIELDKKYFITKLEDGVYLNFYTDIITPQLIGDEKAQVLETLSGAEVEFNERVIMWENERPHYCDLLFNEIKSINITTKDNNGNEILFNNLNKFVIKLHFRLKNEFLHHITE